MFHNVLNVIVVTDKSDFSECLKLNPIDSVQCDLISSDAQ